MSELPYHLSTNIANTCIMYRLSATSDRKYWYWCQASKTSQPKWPVQLQRLEDKESRCQCNSWPPAWDETELCTAWSRCHQPLRSRTSWLMSSSYLLNRFARPHWTTGSSLKQRHREPKQRLWRRWIKIKEILVTSPYFPIPRDVRLTRRFG